jgi:AcrR family transcriptional regulator
VNHDERRRAIADAIYTVIGERGIEAVTLRDVAKQAGVSMGAVQHYFLSKHEMLLFALGYLRERVGARLQPGGSVRDTLRRGLIAMMPVDTRSREEAIVNIAFFGAATHTPEYAKLLLDGYSRLQLASRRLLATAQDAGELRPGVDPETTATSLFFLSQGLVGPVLIGLLTPGEAIAIIEQRLDEIFQEPDVTR